MPDDIIATHFDTETFDQSLVVCICQVRSISDHRCCRNFDYPCGSAPSTLTTLDATQLHERSRFSEAARLVCRLGTLEVTRQSLLARFEGPNLSAQLDMACVRSPLSDYMIAEMLGNTTEQLWRWRNQEAIPADVVELVQAFIAARRDRDSDDESR